MKRKIRILAVATFLAFLIPATALAAFLPYDVGNITDFLDDSAYFNGYSEITGTFDFSGTWQYTAIAFESSNINIVKESIWTWNSTFSTGDISNFGEWDAVNFDTENLYFTDRGDYWPMNVPLDEFNSGGPFKLFQLDADATLAYLSDLILPQGTFIIGFNDNGYRGNAGDADFDDIIVAARPTAAPVPEPATLLLFGTGLIGLAGLGRRRLLNK